MTGLLLIGSVDGALPGSQDSTGAENHRDARHVEQPGSHAAGGRQSRACGVDDVQSFTVLVNKASSLLFSPEPVFIGRRNVSSQQKTAPEGCSSVAVYFCSPPPSRTPALDFYLINNSLRELRSMTGDGCRPDILPALMCRRRDDRSCGIPT